MAYQKNYSFLIKATPEILKLNPKIKILIIGDGPERKELENLIIELRLQNSVLLIGDLPDAYRFLKAFDLFTLTSRYEGMSITLIEAMQAGLPLITSDVGGAKEMLNDENLIYKLDNKKEFISKLSTLILNEALRSSVSIKMNEESKKFDIKNTVDSYLKIY